MFGGGGFESYIKDLWNRFDQAMYIILLVAIILRYTLTSENFMYARYVYAVDLVLFYLRVLQLYLYHKRLGPKVVVIGRMVRMRSAIKYGLTSCIRGCCNCMCGDSKLLRGRSSRAFIRFVRM